MRNVVSLLLIVIFFSQTVTAGASTYNYGSRLSTEENIRINSYLIKHPVQFSEGEKEILADRCQSAQDRIGQVNKNLPDIISKRKNIYGHIDKRLASIQSRLSLQQIDTSIIDLMLVNYRREIINFDDKILKYQQSLSDITKLDCATHPEAFKASLEAVREYRKNVQEAAQEIKELNSNELNSGFNLITKRLSER